MNAIIVKPASTSSTLPIEALQAFWSAQPRAVRLFTPALEVRWDNTPDRLARLPLYRDGRGRSVAMPSAGHERIAWPVVRALAEGELCMRSYWLPDGDREESQCYRVQAYPIETPGEGRLIVEETEWIDAAQCHTERLKARDRQVAETMKSVADFLTSRDRAELLLRMRIANPNLQACHKIKHCRQRACPAYDNPNPRCWEISGTLCHGNTENDDSLKKFSQCNQCDVYRMACPDPLTRIAENINRLLSFLQLNYEEAIEMNLQVQQSEKLAALGELTLGIVHEIKNPLGVLATRLDCLSWELDPSEGARLEADLAVLRSQIDRMRQFLEGLLAFSRPAEIEHRPLQLGEVIRATQPLVGKTLEKAGICLECRIGGDLPAILGDPVSIQQILLNLILNARDAMPKGGTIRITASASPDHPDEVRVEVRDSGRGIEPGELKRIFSPFYSSHHGQGGTGLGLAVCSRIMNRHGGAITATSQPGKGSTFTLDFKRAVDDSSGGRRQI